MIPDADRDSLVPLVPSSGPDGSAIVRGVRIYLTQPCEAWAGEMVAARKNLELDGLSWQEIHDSSDWSVASALKRVVLEGARAQESIDGPVHPMYQRAALVLEARDPSPPVEL
jgi:hypothetical protein